MDSFSGIKRHGYKFPITKAFLAFVTLTTNYFYIQSPITVIVMLLVLIPSFFNEVKENRLSYEPLSNKIKVLKIEP